MRVADAYTTRTTIPARQGLRLLLLVGVLVRVAIANERGVGPVGAGLAFA